MNNLIIVALFCMVAYSCNYVRSASVKVVPITGSEVILNPTIVDIEVKEEKVTGKASGKKQDRKKVAEEALLMALEASKSDVLIEPIYVFEENKRKVTVTVKGFPGNYVNFRPITTSDIEILNAGRTQSENMTKIVGSTDKKKRK